MFCPSCGVESNQKTNFCKRCGANMNLTANSIEARLPAAGISGMVWAIAIFGLAGLIASLAALLELNRNGRNPDSLLVFFLCLAFVFSVTGLLVKQLTRLINTYQEAVKRTMDKAQFEMGLAPQSAPAQPQQRYISPVQEPAPSVAEHTTRQMAGVSSEPNARE